jgi:hypothetical protein
MRKIIFFIPLLFFLTTVGCKKTVDKIKENAVISAMTDGQWIITNFKKDGTVITSDFDGYKFQYYGNRTVDAIKNGVVEKTGTWDGDATTMTITANFSNSVPPLSLLNGAWHVDNNSWTYVVASQNTTTETKSLRLEKL